MADDAPRAVVVDDSGFMRTVITDILEGGGIDVVSVAGDGQEAVERIVEYRPDVVTMDVEMPGMDGLEAVEAIMDTRPTPILMLSAHTEENAAVTFDALDRGAVDFFTKPGGEVTIEMSRFEEQLTSKVRSVARSKVDASGASGGPSTLARPARGADFRTDCTLVIGASTGGPSVVEQVLGALPTEANLRVLVVQHMAAEFTSRYAERLDDRVSYSVREAADGDRVRGGEALLARGGYHLTVDSYRRGTLSVALNQEPPVHGVRPAVDVTMESAARTIDDPLVAVVLTGMGRDGAAGVEAIAEAGGDVIVQDEATSAVFGMPKRAIETGCVDAVCPVDAIPGAVSDAVERRVAP